MKKLYWEYRPEWSGWWLMIPKGGLTSSLGYGPFMNDFEISMAADIHGVPFLSPVKWIIAMSLASKN